MKLTKQKLFSLIESVINENKSDNVLRFMIDLKKFDGGLDEFYKRVKIDYSDPADGEVVFFLNLLLDDKVVGTVNYDLIDHGTGCKPDPIKENERVFVLKTIARAPEVGGYRIGKLISFLSVCVLGHNDCWVTSDRNTSSEAGKNLVSALKVMNAKKSKPFDYVGWFKTTVQDILNDTGILAVHVTTVPEDFKQNADIKRYIQNLHNKITSNPGQDNILKDAYIKKIVIPLLRKLDKHLVPLTTDTIDDCKPSVNLTLGGESEYIRSLPTEMGVKFMEKLLKMNMQEIQDLFDSDDRVQGYSFQFDDSLIETGIKLIEKINKVDDRGSTHAEGGELFKKVYNDETQVDYDKLDMNIMDKFPKNNK